MKRMHIVYATVAALIAPAANAHSPTAPATLRGTVLQRAQQAQPETYYGLMTEEVARARLQKMGFERVDRLEAITPSKGLLRAEVVRNGQTRQIEINRQTGATQELP